MLLWDGATTGSETRGWKLARPSASDYGRARLQAATDYGRRRRSSGLSEDFPRLGDASRPRGSERPPSEARGGCERGSACGRAGWARGSDCGRRGCASRGGSRRSCPRSLHSPPWRSGGVGRSAAGRRRSSPACGRCSGRPRSVWGRSSGRCNGSSRRGCTSPRLSSRRSSPRPFGSAERGRSRTVAASFWRPASPARRRLTSGTGIEPRPPKSTPRTPRRPLSFTGRSRSRVTNRSSPTPPRSLKMKRGCGRKGRVKTTRLPP